MTTREEMVEALREMVPDRDSKPRILTGGEGQQLIDLASRLPTACTEAHEPTLAMLLAGRIVRDGLGGFDTSSIYRAMERARVEGAK